MENSKEKQAIVSMLGSWLILAIYSLYIYYNYIKVNPEIINNIQFWGTAFLVLIPISIVFMIIIHIIFAISCKIITKEDLECQTDEMDKLIELKSVRISHGVFIAGFMTAMASLALGMEIYVMFLLLIAAGFLSGTAESIAKIYFYRKGV